MLSIKINLLIKNENNYCQHNPNQGRSKWRVRKYRSAESATSLGGLGVYPLRLIYAMYLINKTFACFSVENWDSKYYGLIYREMMATTMYQLNSTRF